MKHPYLNQHYTEAFRDLAKIWRLPSSGTPLFAREISQTSHHDLISAYPRTPILSLDAIDNDLKNLHDKNFVTATIATDIFYTVTESLLTPSFDYVKPFKTHYVFNRELPFKLSKHHRYEIKQANKNCSVSIVDLNDCLSHWVDLYKQLVTRHRISGFRCFSESYFESISKIPNLFPIAATVDNEIVSMHLWFGYNNFLYSHLAASNEKGYANRASYAIYNYILKEFTEHQLVDFGGVAGNQNDPRNGLSKFKRGFANETKQSYILGKILNNRIYNELTQSIADSSYFPLYRAPVLELA